MGVPSPDWTASHIKTPPTQISGGPVFEAHLDLLKITLTFFRLKVRNLEILKSVYLPSMSPDSIMPFHNLASIFGPLIFSASTNWPQIGLAE